MIDSKEKARDVDPPTTLSEGIETELSLEWLPYTHLGIESYMVLVHAHHNTTVSP